MPRLSGASSARPRSAACSADHRVADHGGRSGEAQRRDDAQVDQQVGPIAKRGTRFRLGIEPGSRGGAEVRSGFRWAGRQRPVLNSDARSAARVLQPLCAASLEEPNGAGKKGMCYLLYCYCAAYEFLFTQFLRTHIRDGKKSGRRRRIVSTCSYDDGESEAVPAWRVSGGEASARVSVSGPRGPDFAD